MAFWRSKVRCVCQTRRVLSPYLVVAWVVTHRCYFIGGSVSVWLEQAVLDLGALPHLKVLLTHPKKNIREVKWRS